MQSERLLIYIFSHFTDEAIKINSFAAYECRVYVRVHIVRTTRSIFIVILLASVIIFIF